MALLAFWDKSLGKETVKYAKWKADTNNDGIEEAILTNKKYADINGDGKDKEVIGDELHLDINNDGIMDEINIRSFEERVKVHSSRRNRVENL